MFSGEAASSVVERRKDITAGEAASSVVERGKDITAKRSNHYIVSLFSWYKSICVFQSLSLKRLLPQVIIFEVV